MLPTELQRILMLVGLAAIGYLLILAWNEDYIQSDNGVEYAATPEIQNESGLAPAPDASGPKPDSDIPDASLVGPATAAHDLSQPHSDAADSASATELTNRLVKVQTPALEVWIDRLGGDIVRVRLPQYPVSLDDPDIPYLLLDNSAGRTYVAQSGLVGPDGVDSSGHRPLYRTKKSEYLLADPEGKVQIELLAEKDGLEVVKRFTIPGNDYLIGLQYQVNNRRNTAIQASLFAQIKRDSEKPAGKGSFKFGPQPYVGAALTTADSRYEKLKFDDLDDEDYLLSLKGGWIAMLQHYFLSAWVGNSEDENRFYGRRRQDGNYTVGYTSPLQTIGAGATGQWSSRFYAGPKDQKRLEAIAPNLYLTVDYGFLWWLAVPLFKVMTWLHGIAGNWGTAIVLLTVMVKVLLYPLTAASFRSMANMRRVGPQLKRIQERYADDRPKLSQEMMALYKKEGVNPLGGCLPMLLPMPIFLALYWVLFESVELRQAPFIFWIKDLAVMDPFFVLPLLMGASMYFQQLMSPAIGDPMQVKMMRLMPVVFTALFLFFPAGLVLYWLVNNVLSVAQQYWVIRQTDASMKTAK